MLLLILALLIGIGISFFSTQNTHGVTITLANYPLTGIPLYIIVIVSLLTGIILSFIASLFSSVSSFFALQKKESTIHNANTAIKNLQEKVSQLEVENEKLRTHTHEPHIVEREVENRPHVPFLTKLRGGYQ